MVGHFYGGPLDLTSQEVEHAALVVRCLVPTGRVSLTEMLEPTMPAATEVLYRRRPGPSVAFAPALFDYDGPSAYAVFAEGTDQDLSPQFATRREAHEWLRSLLRTEPWFTPCEVRWVYPTQARLVDPDYDVDGPLRKWDAELESERHRLGALRAEAQARAARPLMEAEKRRARVADDPTWILDEVAP